MSRFFIKLGGVYATEPLPGVVDDPVTTPTAVTWLDPLYLKVGVNGNPTELRAMSNLQAEAFVAAFKVGQWIQVADNGYTAPGLSSSSGGSPKIVFDGTIVNYHIVISGETVMTQVIAYSAADFLLHRMPLHGQYRRSHALEETFFESGPSGSPISVEIDTDIKKIDTPLYFNTDGDPNMTQDVYYNAENTSSQQFPIFEVPFRNQMTSAGNSLVAQYWDLISAVKYLLNSTNATWAIDPASFTDTILAAAFSQGNPAVSNSQCEGDTVAQGLMKLLAPHGYGFWIEPWLNTNNLQNINFFYKGVGTTCNVILPIRNTTNYGNLIQADMQFDCGSVVNYLEGYGDRVSYTTLAQYYGMSSSSSGNTLTLIKGWENSDLVFPAVDTYGQTNYFSQDFFADYCNQQLITTGANGEDPGIFGVGRQWVVNQGENTVEDLVDLSAHLTGNVYYSSSSSTSSSSSGASKNESIDTRRFVKPEIYRQNTDGGLLSQEDVIVEMSTDAGNSWAIVDKDWYRILPEGMGIVFTPPDLSFLGYQVTVTPSLSSSSSTAPATGIPYWEAVRTDSIRIRILCAVKGDDRVSAVVQNNGQAYPLAIGGVFNNPAYKKTVYSPSIDPSIAMTIYPNAQITQDDSERLLALTNLQLNNTNRQIVSMALRVLLENFTDYQPGMVVTAINNRAIPFTVTPGMSSSSSGGIVLDGPTIVAILFKFQEQQIELTVDNHRVAPLLRAKPISLAESLRQQQLGVEGVGQLVPGNQGQPQYGLTPGGDITPEQLAWIRNHPNG